MISNKPHQEHYDWKRASFPYGLRWPALKEHSTAVLPNPYLNTFNLIAWQLSIHCLTSVPAPWQTAWCIALIHMDDSQHCDLQDVLLSCYFPMRAVHYYSQICITTSRYASLSNLLYISRLVRAPSARTCLKMQQINISHSLLACRNLQSRDWWTCVMLYGMKERSFAAEEAESQFL